MKDHLLFIDTETSGLPKKWNKPYDTPLNWPYIIQIAWIVFHKDGREIKRENFYINNDDVKLNPSSTKIHGLTKDFLKLNGKKRKQVMSKLAYDIKKYKPLLVGHFMELDFHMMGVDFHRAGIDNPIKDLPMFCTMLTSEKFVKNPQAKFLKLGELYHFLFNKEMLIKHDALADAEATAASFFELLNRGDVNDSTIDNQQTCFKKIAEKTHNRTFWPFNLL